MKTFFRTSAAALLAIATSTAGCVDSDNGDVPDPTQDDGGKADDATSTFQGLDVCDVSLLYPFPKNNEQLNAMPPLDLRLNNGASLLTSAQLNAFLDSMIKPRPAGPGIDLTGENATVAETRAITSWRIVGIRFDPLTSDPAANPLNPPKKTQIRLIAQPYRPGANPKVQDVALHLIFDFPSGTPADKVNLDRRLAKSLQLLKSSSPAVTTGIPLSAHPGLAASTPFSSPGAKGAFPTKVEAWLARELPQAKLASIAMMGLRSGGDVWVFAAAAPQDTRFNNIPLPLVNNSPFIELNLDQQDLRVNKFDPVPSRGINLMGMFTDIGSPTFLASRSTLHLIDNPDKTHVGNVDCVSCHTTTQRLYFTAETNILGRITKLFGFTPSDPNRYSVPQGVTGFVREKDSQRQLWHVGNFRHFNGTPSVSVRTANESAAAADFLNKTVVVNAQGRAVGNPVKLICDEPKVAMCFLSGQPDDVCRGSSLCSPR
jgi:hypothetical protein